MKEQLIEFETAKLAKEKGFVSVLSFPKCYDNGKLIKRPSFSSSSPTDYGDRFIAAPTQSLLQKWLREEYGIKLTIIFRENITTGEESWDWLIKGTAVVYRRFKTYEQALEAGLIEALKLI